MNTNKVVMKKILKMKTKHIQKLNMKLPKAKANLSVKQTKTKTKKATKTTINKRKN